jgi:uncharacterized protein
LEGGAARIFLQSGADALVPSTVDGSTALHWALAAGRIDSCELLLARESALLEMRGLTGSTPLILAAESDCVDTVKLLCEHGADLSAVNDHGTTPLIAACMQNRVKVAAFLLQAGADVHAVDNEGNTAVMSAP